MGGAGIPGGGWTTVLLPFTGSSGQRIAVGASSSWDNYLLLLGPDGSLVGADDDSGGGTDALVVATLPDDGEYVAILLPYNRGDAGIFAAGLAVSAEAPIQGVPAEGAKEKAGGPDSILRHPLIRSIRGMPSGSPRATDKVPSRKPESLWARLGALGISLPMGGEY
jgi:hypothetical protein